MSLGWPVNIYVCFARIHPSKISLFRDLSRHCQSKSRCKNIMCSFPSIAQEPAKDHFVYFPKQSTELGWVFFLSKESHPCYSISVVFLLLSLLSLSLLFLQLFEQQSHYSLKRSPVFLQICSTIARFCVFFDGSLVFQWVNQWDARGSMGHQTRPRSKDGCCGEVSTGWRERCAKQLCLL